MPFLGGLPIARIMVFGGYIRATLVREMPICQVAAASILSILMPARSTTGPSCDHALGKTPLRVLGFRV